MTKIPELIKNFCDALWEYDAKTNQIYIHHDTMTSEFCDRWLEYDFIYDLYRKDHIYRADVSIWENILAPDKLAMFMQGGENSLHFSIRLKSRQGTMLWHEAYIERLDESRLLISSRDIQNIQRNASIAQAVIPEFDYVCYIDIKTNSYILYSSGDKDTIIPENVFDDYSLKLREFNKAYVIPEECDELTANMEIDHVVNELKDKDEYVLYATVNEHGKLFHKKLRFCYSDETRTKLLLSRVDISDIVREQKMREAETRFLMQELENNREEMRRVLESTTDLVFQYGVENGEIILSNMGKLETYHTYSQEELFLLLAREEIMEEDCISALEEGMQKIRQGEHSLSVDIRARKDRNSDFSWYRVTFFDYRDMMTHERRVQGYLQNIDQIMEKQERLMEEAQRDPLTGVYNAREGKRSILEKLLNHSGDSYHAMFIMDIDDFKKINDSHGHIVGDEVLKAFSEILKESFRSRDVIYRLGGDEFAVFTENIQDPETVIARIMTRFFANIEKVKTKYSFLSSSVGVFVSNRKRSFEEYYKEADRALYQTKQGGKSHYTLFVDSGLSAEE